MTYVEDWYSLENQQALADLYDKVRNIDGDVIEVGCWEGRSTIALANACHPTTLHAVDTWEGSPGEISAELAQERDVYYQFACNIEDHTCGNVQAHRCTWRTYFDEHTDPIKFVHIDATHTYAEVRDNIRAVLPLLVRGAVVCGDDFHYRPVARAVVDVLGVRVNAAGTNLWHWRKP